MRSLEISDGVPVAIAEVSNTRLRGRKMMLMKRVLREKMKEEPLNKENSKISGKRTYASKKHHQSSQESLKDQNESRLLKAKSGSARSQQAPAKRPNQASYQYSKPVSTTTGSRLECSSRSTIPNPQEFDSSSQNLESQKLLDKAATEIVNLMNKDYPGGGGPRHKPPINNDQPMSDQQHYPRP
ncbi:uncharacterized protein LOC131175608 [Hevea brasiliensis]|uniref:uncharacterized protein LOC131175608 n=1 Tax=Hevea brasiliensis TaxID=3981 RepID=UPI0025FEF7EC|nr:uncharacterized protein LOC131175608 [Hevea brasiliensis]